MEAFSFLKHRPTGDSNSATTVVIPHFSDDGSFFDLQFALPDAIPEEDEYEEEEDEEDMSDNEDEEALSFDDENVELSGTESEIMSEDNSKFLFQLVKSASKFRVMLLKLKRSKSVNGSVEKSGDGEEEEEGESEKGIEEKQGKSGSGKFFTVKFKIDDVKLPLVSLFTSSKEVKGDAANFGDSNSTSAEGKLTKEMLHKYLKMVKPLYFLVTKNYVGKLRFSGNVGGGDGGGVVSPRRSAAEKGLKSGGKQGSGKNLVAKLKVVRKNLGKSQASSATVAAVAPVVTGRRDDSMVEVQDGIQGAIMHCKKSLNASKSNGEESTSTLCPWVQDTCEKSATSTFNSEFANP